MLHSKKKSGSGETFEATLWKAANKLRSSMDPQDTMHVVLGLIFLKYVSDQGTQMPIVHQEG